MAGRLAGKIALISGGSTGTQAGGQVVCRTNTSSQIGTRGSAALTYELVTFGWLDTRGRFS